MTRLFVARSRRQGKGRAVLVRKHARLRKMGQAGARPFFSDDRQTAPTHFPNQSPVPLPYHNPRC